MRELLGHKRNFNCSLKFDLCVLCPSLHGLQTLDVFVDGMLSKNLKLAPFSGGIYFWALSFP